MKAVTTNPVTMSTMAMAYVRHPLRRSQSQGALPRSQSPVMLLCSQRQSPGSLPVSELDQKVVRITKAISWVFVNQDQDGEEVQASKLDMQSSFMKREIVQQSIKESEEATQVPNQQISRFAEMMYTVRFGEFNNRHM